LLVLVPERFQPDGIAEVGREDASRLRLEQQEGDLAESASRTEQQSEHSGAQDVVGTRSPEPLVSLSEKRDQLIACDLVQVRVVALEQIETDWLVAKGGVYKNDAIPMPARNALEQVADKVTFGVDYCDTSSRLDVAKGQVQEQRALAYSSRSDNIHVVQGVGG